MIYNPKSLEIIAREIIDEIKDVFPPQKDFGDFSYDYDPDRCRYNFRFVWNKKTHQRMPKCIMAIRFSEEFLEKYKNCDLSGKIKSKEKVKKKVIKGYNNFNSNNKEKDEILINDDLIHP